MGVGHVCPTQKTLGCLGGFAEEELEHLKHLAAQMDEAFPEATWQ